MPTKCDDPLRPLSTAELAEVQLTDAEIKAALREAERLRKAVRDTLRSMRRRPRPRY